MGKGSADPALQKGDGLSVGAALGRLLEAAAHGAVQQGGAGDAVDVAAAQRRQGGDAVHVDSSEGGGRRPGDDEERAENWSWQNQHWLCA